ncbi:MAG: tRNA (adenosine(37)-N6)-threonylcarbamoyltransferase complex dimerization subunit type 1 TsaB [Clostridia bacterium]|nr:tRNA (adenosine(37)-N6)-threonylcarbamoyltransferase complex dimerization subunit type 1 TsaB [Clostridia bacterium]
MKILAIESSAGPASVCILDDDKILYESYSNVGLTHSRTIMPMVEQALKMTSLTVSDIDTFAVACGPGSFTGVRIGVSAVKGMALGADKGCFGVSTLEAMAYNLLNCDCTVCAVMDARCAQVYCGLFSVKDGIVSRIMPDEAVAIETLKEKIKKIDGKIFLVGDGAGVCYAQFEDLPNVTLAAPQQRFQRASGVALCAKNAIANGEKTVDAGDLDVVYLRLPQAERELKKKKEQGQ